MKAEDIKEILTGRPFSPVRMWLSDGKSYVVRHPDQVYVMRHRIIIGLESDPKTGIVERSDQVAIAHIVRVEPVGNGAARRRRSKSRA